MLAISFERGGLGRERPSGGFTALGVPADLITGLVLAQQLR